MARQQRNQIRKHGDRYQVTVELSRDPLTGERKRKWETFDTYGEAKAWRDDTLSKMNRGVLVDDGKLTLGRYVLGWLDGSLVARAPSTRSNLRSIVERHILPSPVASVRLGKITTHHVATLYGSLPENGTTRLRVHRALHSALEEAVDRDLIAYNPAAKRAVRQSYRRRTRVKTWTTDEVSIFLASVPEAIGNRRARFSGMRDACHVALHTGLRLGELLGLEWSGPRRAAIDARRSAEHDRHPRTSRAPGLR